VTLTNLKPICRLCNSSMGTKNMKDFMEQYGFVEKDVTSLSVSIPQKSKVAKETNNLGSMEVAQT